MKLPVLFPLGLLVAVLTSLAPSPATAQVQPRAVESDDGESAVRSIGYGALEVGRLRPGDGQLRAGEFRDLYTFEGKAGDPVLIDLVSDDFDPYLAIISPSGKVLRNDDWGSTPAARIQTRLIEDGAYRVIVTSFRPGEQGTYLLRLQDRRIRIAD
ncbi:MAG: hypothetical protein HKO53_04320 [Gemmatimonadetes bacterium]|nr:hypothetical protein [Gemmatimonadota bacterium]